MSDYRHEHALIERLFRAGIAAVEPRVATRRALEETGIPPDGRIIVLAIGKAASAMAFGAADVLGDRIDAGVILTKDGHLDAVVPGFAAYEARHPLPDQRGFDATSAILELVSDLDSRDAVIALISGGGSALLEAPVAPITLMDFQRITELLLRAGAPIQDLNAVRSAISRVKRGGLRRAIGPARCISLILSDVLGNDPAVIASGPTIATAPDSGTALDIISRYNLKESVPESIVSALASSTTIRSLSDDRDVWSVIGDNRTMLNAVAHAARDENLHPEIVWNAREGEARDLGVAFAGMPFPEGIDLMVGGGEATVTVRGDGVGGRNTEFALAAAFGLEDRVVASLASDGDDGSASAAGAIVDPCTIARGSALGLDARDSLDRNDSAAYVAATGDLLQSGPTGTNVNDVYLALRIER